MTKYLVEPIGASFDKKAQAGLGDLFTQRAAEGYELHNVFQVSEPGCMGFGNESVTYLAVYKKAD